MDPQTRSRYLERLGLSELRLRGEMPESVREVLPERSQATMNPVETGSMVSEPAPANYLVANSSPEPQRKSMPIPAVEAPLEATADEGIEPVAEIAADWPGLATQVARCTACGLHRERTQTVFGTGYQHSDLLLVGEGPGEQEDLRGEPFLGLAGDLLDRMLQAIGRDRRTGCYIANVVKCRPPGNRKPNPSEAEACGGYLDRQIELVAPKLIVALGGAAAHRLLQNDLPVGKLREQLHDYKGIPMLVTYHPAFYLRSPSEKAKGWADLKRVRDLLAQ